MKRKDFLKKGIGALSSTMLIPALAFKKESVEPVSACAVTSSETAGPFPTISPSSLVMSDIRSDRTGYTLTCNITIQNTQNSCAALQGAIVDIWHCDAAGNYSEYGGTSMQSTNYTTVHFLRGRQTTNSAGLVTFTSIFPGWYTSRATHIHVHIYNSSGTSLLVTQIAFPEGSGTALAAVNGYAKGMTGYTYNASDNVFSDSVANELATVTGSTSAGFVLTHTIMVAGGVVTCAANGGTLSF